jgi:parallel beta-helix repeat protein
MTAKSEGMRIPGKLKWYAILALALWLAFSGVAAAEQLYVNEGGWWRDGGAFNASTAPIQAAVDNATAGDSVFVWNGSYIENVDVNKQLTLEGEGADVVTVDVASISDHVFEVTADYVNISGFTVMGTTGYYNAGIYIDGVNRCNIFDNNISKNWYGIYLDCSSNNTLTSNIANSNGCGIYMWSSSTNNTLTSNIANSNNGRGIYLRYSSNNTLINNTANSNGLHGIHLYFSRDNLLMNSTVSLNSNGFGIYLWSSSNNTLTNNTANSNGCGVYLSYNSYGIPRRYSSNNTLINNTANSNGCGIHLLFSRNNTLINTTMSGNTYNFCVDGDSLSDYIQNIDTSNTVGGKPIYYWVDKQDKQIPCDAGFVGVVNSTNITVRDLTLLKNTKGVLFAYTKDSRIENVTVSGNDHGIYMESSSTNNLTSNTISDNCDYGIYLLRSSNNTLSNNIVMDNSNDGICLCSSSDNILTSNTVNLNNMCGIHLSSLCNYNILTNNTINLNKCYGVDLYYSSSNTLTNNTLSSSDYYGIRLRESSNCNNIIGNLVQNNTYKGFCLRSGSTNNNISYNNVLKNGNYNTSTGGWEWQFYNDQPKAVDAKHNYWGAGMNNSTIDASIYDDEEGGHGEVEFYPFETEPVLCAPTPEESHTFTTIDAVIALQIAVGSRPPDLRWDLSGDGSVTSLDALMILQAAAHAIDL